MAVIPLKKVLIVGFPEHKEKVLKAVQDFGVMHVDEPSFEDESLAEYFKGTTTRDDEAELKVANLEFVIKLLSPFAKKRGLLEGPVVVSPRKAKAVTESLDYEAIIENCKELEVSYSNAKTTLELLENARKSLTPWKRSKLAPKEKLESDGYQALFMSANSSAIETFKKRLAETSQLFEVTVVNETKAAQYATLIYNKEVASEVKSLLSELKIKEAQLPEVQTSVSDALTNIAHQEKDANKAIKEIESELKKIAANFETLQIIHDYFKWNVDLHNVSEHTLEGDVVFALSGWLPVEKMEEVDNALKDKTNNSISIIELETEEESPVLLNNKGVVAPFENVTTLYGLPHPTEADPTAYLSFFFILFFGLALTDAGYGIIMTIAMLLAMKYIKMSRAMKSFAKLLAFGGVFTFIMGMLYGGWFGMTIDQAPEFLTVVNDEGTKEFIFQIFNPIENPLSVLIFSLILGYIQTVVGVGIALYQGLTRFDKKTAILDHGTWFVTLISLGVVIAGAAGVVGEGLSQAFLYIFYLSLVVLILTQGRDKKNPVMKLLSGILSLYGLVGYFGDILSYSRLLALGLATSIIGLAVNTVAGLAGDIPVIGWLLVIIVVTGGHLFNLIINALGAFIHAARLQFVEFFSKFLIGGGKSFKAFRKESRYVMLERDM